MACGVLMSNTDSRNKAIVGCLLATGLILASNQLYSHASKVGGRSAFTPRPPSPEGKQGKALFDKNSCSVCHSIAQSGGCLGPPLDGVGRYRSEEFLLSRITNSAAARAKFDRMYRLPELMPHPRLAPGKAKQIVAYLLTLPEPTGGFKVTPHVAVSEETSKPSPEKEASNDQTMREGRVLYHDLGCAACHSIGDIGGHIGPALDGVAKRRSREYVVEHMTGAKLESDADKSSMPPVKASKKEISRIADFLMSLPDQ